MANSTLSVTQTNNANALVASLVGSGLAVVPGSAAYTGAATSVGTFTGGGTLGVDTGVILSSGNIGDAPQPASNTADTATGTSGDPALSTLAGGAKTYDAATLSFSFTTSTGAISFQYVFGTEEFPAFVGSQFDDVFGFFVDGKNIALVPGTNQPVSVNTVNTGTNSNYFRDNTVGNTPYNVVYNGLTTVLTASVNGLTPGVHTLRLSVADVADEALDSAVFLAGGTFSANTNSFTGAAVDANKPDGATGTTPFTFSVTRSGNLSAATLTYTVTGSGANPADPVLFANPSGSIAFGQGATTANLDVLINGASVTAAENFTVTFFDSTGQAVSTQTGTIQQNFTAAALPPGFDIPGAGPAVGASPSPAPFVGSVPVPAPPAAVLTTPVQSDTIPVKANTVGVQRFFDTTTGTHFFTGSATETNQIQSSLPAFKSEGLAFGAVAPAAAAADPNDAAVYRFFNIRNGTEFLTASATERDSLIGSSQVLSYQGTAFFEHAVAQAGDTAVYRFYDSTTGTHFLTASANETAALAASRPDLTAEGIAFYAPALS